MTVDTSADEGAANDPDLLSPQELAAWRGFLQWSESVTAKVGADLLAGAAVSRAEYEVLRRLLDRGGTLRQHELQRALHWSASRASHQLRRMMERGLLARDEAGPGRPVLVAVLPLGRARMAAADHVHAEAVRRHFLTPLSADMTALGAILRGIGGDPHHGLPPRSPTERSVGSEEHRYPAVDGPASRLDAPSP